MRVRVLGGSIQHCEGDEKTTRVKDLALVDPGYFSLVKTRQYSGLGLGLGFWEGVSNTAKEELNDLERSTWPW